MDHQGKVDAAIHAGGQSHFLSLDDGGVRWRWGAGGRRGSAGTAVGVESKKRQRDTRRGGWMGWDTAG